MASIGAVTGKAPDLYVTDMRSTDTGVTTAGAFISGEMRVRYLNPHWIGEMQKEGHAGANAMLNIVNNLRGWQVTDPASVRADQWQAMHDVYVRDSRKLGLDRFFEQAHPSARLQIVNRMLKAIRRRLLAGRRRHTPRTGGTPRRAPAGRRCRKPFHRR